ncbi:MAG TPA: Gfo/Idh/MocA family oxidoreductase [Oscillospiraceae bacterium]|nr:Gfo/Idh/MocA family oxidoreductase [Oscillospiraceae bacterium]
MQRCCVIGMGHIGNIHARAYKECEKATLVGVCDKIEERAKSAGEKFGVPYFLSAREMLRALKPDICSVSTGGFEYASDHFEPTIEALEFGCHVLGEKPISNNLIEAQKMVDTAEKLNLCYGIDLNHRFTPAARQAKRWQEEGRIGELLFCNMALWIGRDDPLDTPYYHLKALNPHSVNIMQYFCGPVKEVSCFALKALGRQIYSTASVNMRFSCGAVGHLTSSYDIKRGHPMERCEVAGVNGRFIFEDMWREATLYPAESWIKEVYTNPVFGGFEGFYDTFRDRIHSFVNQVEEGIEPKDIDGSAKEGLEASRVIHAAIKSIKENGAVINVADIKE